MFPEQEVALSTGEVVVMRPFMFCDFDAVSELVGKYQGLFSGKAEQGNLMGFLTNKEGMEDALSLIQFCCDLSIDFKALRFDDVGNLFFAAVEVNANFLLARIQQTITTFRAMADLSRMTLAGEISSPFSSVMDTNGSLFDDTAKIS